MLINYFTRHMQASLYSLGKLTRTPLRSLATCLMIGIALALPIILFLTLKNAEMISGSFQQTMQMTLYLKNNTMEADVRQLAAHLRTDSRIKTVRAISPTEGLQELQQQAGFDTPNSLQENPLPWTLVIQPTESSSSPAALETLEQHVKSSDKVDTVQLDILWVKRLASLMTLAHRISATLAIFLGFAVLFIVNNTIRAATQQHHKEIEIIKLIGGTHAFIRRPFLYAGMGYGLLGGIIAWLLVDILLLIMKNPSRHLAELYGSQFTLTGMSLTNLFILLAGSVVLGFIGSWLAVAKHLKK